MMNNPNKDFYTTKEVGRRVGVSRDTIIRWLRNEKIAEPARDRNGHRIFTEDEALAIERYANTIVPSPKQRQQLALNPRAR